jgi:hypothetical protein
MRRLLIASVLLVALGSGVVCAQAQQQSYPPQGGTGGGGYDQGSMTQGGSGTGPGMMGGGYGYGYGMGRGMMRGGFGYGRGFMHGPGGGPCLGCIVACASMVMPQLTATSDGGVVAAVGGKLIKYDAALRKVAETNINIDWTQVQQRVEQMIQNCPAHRRMMTPPGQYRGQPQQQFQGQPQGQSQGQ